MVVGFVVVLALIGVFVLVWSDCVGFDWSDFFAFVEVVAFQIKEKR